jgi:hypothetical protein
MKYEIVEALMYYACKLSAEVYEDSKPRIVKALVEYEMFGHYAPKWGVDII